MYYWVTSIDDLRVFW